MRFPFKLSRLAPLLAVLCAAGVGWAQDDVPASIKAAVKKADDAVTAIVAVPAGNRTFDNTVGALDDISVRLDDDTSMFLFQQYVSTDAAVRDQSRASEEFVGNWASALLKREDLYNAIKGYADTKPSLKGEQKRLLEFTLRDFRRNGMALPKDKRDRLQAIDEQLTKLGIEFQTNINEDETRVPFLPEELPGVPQDTLDRQPKSNGLLLVGMDGPTYSAVLDHCTNPITRQKTWMAYKRRGGERNVTILEKMIKLRAEEASILSFPTYADYVVEPRMAKNEANVKKFYEQLRPVVRKKAQVDWDMFVDAKRKDTKDATATLYPWDYSYYKNLLMKEKYAVDSEKVAEYFPMERVVQGIFDITSKLYDISYKDVTADASKLGWPVWHPEVKLYEVSDNKTHEVLGHMFTDLYPRANKYTHAACWGLISRKVWKDGSVQKPMAALVCNFTKSTAEKPSLLPHDEVETFFHEFGHGIHNMLTNVRYGRFSGTAVERDFVEAPSQMMENWVWEPEVLKLFAKHYKTGQALPESLLNGMVAARSLGSGLETEHQIYYGMVDQKYHTIPNGVVDTTKIGVDSLSELELYKGVPETYYQASFGHLVGYDAAYYGYLWSLVFAQDMFQRFKQLGVLSPKTGAYYREKVLSKGGTEDAMDMLKDYLGREPKMDAFLEYLGLSAT
ncbi:MAG: thimet oligopeptidase, partial [Fimbriimonadaceae bacterium]|nr:thimet oligopeptidase [Fimbriimonadaceae bacterium]